MPPSAPAASSLRTLEPQRDAPGAIAPSSPNSIRVKAGKFWTWLLAWTATQQPWIVPKVTPFFLWFAWRCSPYTRLATVANARRILGETSTPAQREALANAIVANFFQFMAEIGRNLGRTIPDILSDVASIEGMDNYRAARAKKRGAILAAAHLGPYEVAVAGLRQHEPKVHVVFQRDRNIPAFENLRAKLHEHLGLIEAPVENTPGALGPWLGLRDALARDEVVLLQADRVMPGQRGIRLPFCHGHIEVPPGPVKLALATGSPIIPVFSSWEKDGRVRIVMEKTIEVTEPWPRSGVHPALLELTRIIEKHVRQHPDQWHMFDPAFCEDQEAIA
jgi:KDO2-lipid IV(A) lauroyltransferase